MSGRRRKAWKLLMRDEAKERAYYFRYHLLGADGHAGHRGHADGFGHCDQRRYAQLDENAVDILDKQVENRAGYIQDQLQQAQELTDLSTYINGPPQMLDDETLSSRRWIRGSERSAAAAGYSPKCRTLRSSALRSIFLILNTTTSRAAPPETACPAFTCATSTRMQPLCGKLGYFARVRSVGLVRTFDIATDKGVVACCSIWTESRMCLCPSLQTASRRRRAYGGGELWPLDDSAI